MAEFCKQCSEAVGLPNDAKVFWDYIIEKSNEEDVKKLKSGEFGVAFLCEHCGFTLIGEDGECLITDCLGHDID